MPPTRRRWAAARLRPYQPESRWDKRPILGRTVKNVTLTPDMLPFKSISASPRGQIRRFDICHVRLVVDFLILHHDVDINQFTLTRTPPCKDIAHSARQVTNPNAIQRNARALQFAESENPAEKLSIFARARTRGGAQDDLQRLKRRGDLGQEHLRFLNKKLIFRSSWGCAALAARTSFFGFFAVFCAFSCSDSRASQ